jgi:Bacterial protein of unknown function (DUF937)
MSFARHPPRLRSEHALLHDAGLGIRLGQRSSAFHAAQWSIRIMNLVSLAMKFVTPEMLLKLAGATGLQGMIVQKALGAIVPAILGGLIGKASKPDGARSLFDMLGNQDPGILGKLGGMIGGSGQADLVKQGTGLLGSLLGGGAASSLTGTVAKFAGIGDGPAGALMGMLAPAILGTVGQEARNAKLDAGGLASLLAGQKDNISAAMPAGFSDMLKGAGLGDSLLSGLGGMTGAAGHAASQAAGHVTSAAGNVGNVAGRAATGASDLARGAAQSSMASMGWLKWVAGLAAIALLGWYFLGRTPPSTIAIPTFPKIMSGSTDVGSQMGGVLGTLSTTLASVRDADGAKTALPKLQAVVGDVDKISDLAGKLPGDGRKVLATAVSGAMPGISSSMTALLAIPGVAAILKPVIEALQNKLGALAKA